MRAERLKVPEQAIFGQFLLRWEFRFGNVNTICMEEPIFHVLGFTKLFLRQFGGTPSS